jgi:hypothetical protein
VNASFGSDVLDFGVALSGAFLGGDAFLVVRKAAIAYTFEPAYGELRPGGDP